MTREQKRSDADKPLEEENGSRNLVLFTHNSEYTEAELLTKARMRKAAEAFGYDVDKGIEAITFCGSIQNLKLEIFRQANRVANMAGALPLPAAKPRKLTTTR